MINSINNCPEGGILFIYYSGHGSYTYDRSKDELDGRDESIVTSDLKQILDDELKSILKTYINKNMTVIGLFDSCHSGTILDLKFTYDVDKNRL